MPPVTDNGTAGAGVRSLDKRSVVAAGVFTAVMQTILLREVLAVTGGNELIIGVVLSGWLAATAAGSETGRRFPAGHGSVAVPLLIVFSLCALFAVRGSRLFGRPGEELSPVMILVVASFIAALPALAGGYLFGAWTVASTAPDLYRREQAGTLAGLALVSAAVALSLPHTVIIAVAALPLFFCMPPRWLRFTAGALLLIPLASDHTTAAWKYPVAVTSIETSRDGEIAEARSDGNRVLFVNGRVLVAGFSTPFVEKSVHTPCSMHPHPRKILIINGTAERVEAQKYKGAEVVCMRTDHLPVDGSCSFGDAGMMRGGAPYDVVIVGGGLPETIAQSRVYTVSFLRFLQSLTADSGIVSLTLPFTSEIPDRHDVMVRDIVFSTMRKVFPFVRAMPCEGVTFTGSRVAYALPDTCRVPNGYFVPVILHECTAERIAEANRPPRYHRIHTIAHPQLLYASIDRYIGQFGMQWWIVSAVPVMLTILLFIAIRSGRDTASIGTSGFVAGVFSVAVMLCFQGVYGTVYLHVSLLLLAFAAGLAAGAFVRRFPFSDGVIGIVAAGVLLLFAAIERPPAILFFGGNFIVGALVAAQFVTLTRSSTAVKYAADCAGGIIGMALTSTFLVPYFGISAVAAGILLLKVTVSGWRAVHRDG